MEGFFVATKSKSSSPAAAATEQEGPEDPVGLIITHVDGSVERIGDDDKSAKDQKGLDLPGIEDAVLELMLKCKIPMTRENYLEVAYLGQLPDPWTLEHELELPEQFQDKAVIQRLLDLG
jgi:hypothetical protein